MAGAVFLAVLGALGLAWATAPLWGRFTAALPDAVAWCVPVAQASWPVGLALAVVGVVLCALTGTRRPGQARRSGQPGHRGRTPAALLLCAGVLVTTVLAPAALDHAGRSAAAPAKEPGTFRVLSVNTWYHQADRGRLAELAGDLRPDAVMLLETSTAEVMAVERVTGLRSVLPVSTRSRGGGTALLLAPDAISGAPVPAHDARMTRHQMPVATVPDGPTVAAVHTDAPFNSELVTRWTSEFDDLRSRAATTASGPVRDAPLLLAGDFNASAAHPEFRRLVGGADSADSADSATGLSDCTGGTSGVLAAPTWPAAGVASYPVARLDHILVRGGDCLAGGTVDVPGSDHRGVWADVRLP